MPQLEDFADSSMAVLSSDLLQAIREAELPDVDGGPSQRELAECLRRSSSLEGVADDDSARRTACLSGLWLLAGDLDRSHTLSQSLDTAEGAFWHGIMHRREGDFGNAKYWFRRVGPHPVLDQLRDRMGDLYPDGAAFVDASARAAGGDAEAREACRRAQWLEWQLLFVHCLQK